MRLRTAVELEGDARQLPKDHDPVHELTTLTELAGGILRLPGATGLFFPGGETLRSREQVEAVLRRKTGLGSPPIDLWLNTRGISLGQEGDARWMLVDVVGMRQVRLPDQEALFAEGHEDPEAAAAFLRNACLRLIAGKGIPEGSTSDDVRGRRWKVSAATGVLAPNRPVLRWLPEESTRPSEAFLAKLPQPPPIVPAPAASPPRGEDA